MFSLFKKKSQQTDEYKFSEPENTACFTCDHIVSKKNPILFVFHDEDGDWQFLCGEEHSNENAKIVSLKNMTKLDPTINELYSMPNNTEAQRKSRNDKWKVIPL